MPPIFFGDARRERVFFGLTRRHTVYVGTDAIIGGDPQTGPPTWSPITLPDARESTAYTPVNVGVFSTNADSWALAGTSDPLPAGMSFDPVTGFLSGTPDPGTRASYDLVFTAINAEGSTDSDVTPLTVKLRLHAWSQTPTPPQGEVGTSYSGYNYANDLDDATGITFSWTDNPPGLTLAPTGEVTGTPTAAAVYSPTVTAASLDDDVDAPAHSLTVVDEVTRMRLEDDTGYWLWGTGGDTIAWG